MDSTLLPLNSLRGTATALPCAGYSLLETSLFLIPYMASDAVAAAEQCAQVDVTEMCGACCEESGSHDASEAASVVVAAVKRQRVAVARSQIGTARSNVRKSPRLAMCGCNGAWACTGVSHA